MPAPRAVPVAGLWQRPAAQKGQRCELVDEASGLDCGRDQDEKRSQQGQPPVHHLEQFIEDQRQGDIGHSHHEVRREARSVQQLVCLDVVRRGRHIGREQGGANEADGEGAPDDVDQVQGAGNPRQLAR